MGSGRIASAVVGTSLVVIAATLVDVPRGERPDVTPTVEILSPAPAGNAGQGATARLGAGEPLTVRTSFTDLDFRPDLVTDPPDETLATEPQTVTDGRVQGHIHIYAIEVGDEDNRADPFCIYEDDHLIDLNGSDGNGFDGIVERECGSLTPGVWDVSVDVNTNAHDQVLKAHPRDMPTSDSVRVVVPGPPERNDGPPVNRGRGQR